MSPGESGDGIGEGAGGDDFAGGERGGLRVGDECVEQVGQRLQGPVEHVGAVAGEAFAAGAIEGDREAGQGGGALGCERQAGAG